MLPHGQAREPPKGPCNRWRGLYPTVKWLGWGNARVSLPSRIHILDFPGVTGFLWSQSHTPFLWSFSLPPEEDYSWGLLTMLLPCCCSLEALQNSSSRSARAPWL